MPASITAVTPGVSTLAHYLSLEKKQDVQEPTRIDLNNPATCQKWKNLKGLLAKDIKACEALVRGFKSPQFLRPEHCRNLREVAASAKRWIEQIQTAMEALEEDPVLEDLASVALIEDRSWVEALLPKSEPISSKVGSTVGILMMVVSIIVQILTNIGISVISIWLSPVALAGVVLILIAADIWSGQIQQENEGRDVLLSLKSAISSCWKELEENMLSQAQSLIQSQRELLVSQEQIIQNNEKQIAKSDLKIESLETKILAAIEANAGQKQIEPGGQGNPKGMEAIIKESLERGVSKEIVMEMAKQMVDAIADKVEAEASQANHPASVAIATPAVNDASINNARNMS